MKKTCLVIIVLLLSGCTSVDMEEKLIDEDNAIGEWYSDSRTDDGLILYILFFENNIIETNIIYGIVVTGTYRINDMVLIIVHAGNQYAYDITFSDDTYQTLKIKDKNEIITVFTLEK